MIVLEKIIISIITIHLAQLKSPYNNGIIKLKKDRAFIEWKSIQYEYLYYKEDDEDLLYDKYNYIKKYIIITKNMFLVK